MNPTGYLVVYCVLVALAALAGGAIPMMVRLSHRRMQVATSLIGGFMLGVSLLSLLPHAVMAVPIGSAVGWMVAGLLTMFFMERVFSYHHHTAPGDPDLPPVTADPQPDVACGRGPGEPIDHRHGHDAAAVLHPGHGHGHGHGRAHAGPAALSWAGVGIGLAIHSLINGAALAAAVVAEAHLDADSHPALLPGLAVFLVVALHKPFDSMALLALMTTSGTSKKARVLVNLAYATSVPIGAAIFALGIAGLDLHESAPLGYALAFTSGMFLCVALADLLPEVQFHTHDKALLSAAMLIGLALAWGITAMESAIHDHDDAPHGQTSHGHDL